MRLILVIILNALLFSAVAQDSLVYRSEIKFNSTFERDAFNRFLKGNTKQLINLFLSTDSTVTTETAAVIKGRIDASASSLQQENLEKKKTDKRIKFVYDNVHQSFLRKYELHNRFAEVFTSGNYNCVTATALFAMVFDDLNIPYQIKETPTHVYLISYPNQENIMVETTAPASGYVSYSDEFKANFVETLKKQKIIGEVEAHQKTTEELFNAYYFKNDGIDLRKLAGLHYINDALFLRDESKWLLSLHQLEKAYLLYPSARCEYLLMVFSSYVVSQKILTPVEKAKQLGKLSRFTKLGITNEMILSEFQSLNQDILIRQNNTKLSETCYQAVLSKVADKELKNDISYYYLYERGRLLYNQGSYARARSFFEKALAIQPTNVELSGIFLASVGETFRTMNNASAALDSLTRYEQKFPSLKDFPKFNTAKANVLLASIGEDYDAKKIADAEKKKKLMDAMVQSNPEIQLEPSFVGKAFGAAAQYYFRLGQKNKARELLNEGLKLSPNNYELRIRMQMIR